MPRTLISVELNKPIDEQTTPLHNRWHPDIPAVVAVTPGEVFRVECVDCVGGQIQDNDSAEDVLKADVAVCHPLSGPISVKGAEPGDLLVVDILDIGYFQGHEWGFTGISPHTGFLGEDIPKASKAIWKFEGIYAVSRHIPGVRFVGLIHPGLIGCAPSHELLKEWNERERILSESGTSKGGRPLAALPTEKSALLGKIQKSESPELWDRMSKEAARTLPPRENDFSEGDGEIALCGAIEMAGWIDLKVDIIKGGMKLYKTINPIFIPGPVEPRYSSYLTFEGISVENGKQFYLDANVAFRQACLNAVRHLTCFGYTEEQAYLLLSAAPIEGRISGIVDIPNACCTVAIPTEIFDFDIKPAPGGPKKLDN